MTSALGIGALGFAAVSVGLAIYLVVLRDKMASLSERLWVISEMSTKRAAQLVEDAEAIKAHRAEIAGLKKRLAAELLEKGGLYELLRKTGGPGAGALVDAGIRSLYPDADDHVAPSGDGAGPVPDLAAAPAADAGEDDLFRRGR